MGEDRREAPLVRIGLFRKNRGFEEQEYPVEVGPLLADENHLLWVDAEDPSPEELDWVRAQFRVHPIAMEDYDSRHERARIDRYPAMYSIVFYAMSRDEAKGAFAARTLTVFLGERYMVTLHEEPFPEIREARELWERNEDEMECEIGTALYALLDVVIDDYFPLLDRIAEEVEDVEDQILEAGKPAELDQIFKLKRQLLDLRRAVSPERDVLNVLLRRELPLFSEGMTVYFQDLYDHVVRVLDSLDTHRDLLSSALDLYVSVASNRLNATMQTLTSWSIILMSSSLVAGIYGMNFRYMPELGLRYGYYAALAAMLALGLGLVAYFRRRGWL
jgi:magnesium transporter